MGEDQQHYAPLNPLKGDADKRLLVQGDGRRNNRSLNCRYSVRGKAWIGWRLVRLHIGA